MWCIYVYTSVWACAVCIVSSMADYLSSVCVHVVCGCVLCVVCALADCVCICMHVECPCAATCVCGYALCVWCVLWWIICVCACGMHVHLHVWVCAVSCGRSHVYTCMWMYCGRLHCVVYMCACDVYVCM